MQQNCSFGRWCTKRDTTLGCPKSHECRHGTSCRHVKGTGMCAFVHPGEEKVRPCRKGRLCTVRKCPHIHVCYHTYSGKECFGRKNRSKPCLMEHPDELEWEAPVRRNATKKVVDSNGWTEVRSSHKDVSTKLVQPEPTVGVETNEKKQPCKFGRWCFDRLRNDAKRCVLSHACWNAERCWSDVCHRVHPGEEGTHPCPMGVNCKDSDCKERLIHDCFYSFRGMRCQKRVSQRCTLFHRNEKGYNGGQSCKRKAPASQTQPYQEKETGEYFDEDYGDYDYDQEDGGWPSGEQAVNEDEWGTPAVDQSNPPAPATGTSSSVSVVQEEKNGGGDRMSNVPAPVEVASATQPVAPVQSVWAQGVPALQKDVQEATSKVVVVVTSEGNVVQDSSQPVQACVRGRWCEARHATGPSRCVLRHECLVPVCRDPQCIMVHEGQKDVRVCSVGSQCDLRDSTCSNLHVCFQAFRGKDCTIRNCLLDHVYPKGNDVIDEAKREMITEMSVEDPNKCYFGRWCWRRLNGSCPLQHNCEAGALCEHRDSRKSKRPCIFVHPGEEKVYKCRHGRYCKGKCNLIHVCRFVFQGRPCHANLDPNKRCKYQHVLNEVRRWELSGMGAKGYMDSDDEGGEYVGTQCRFGRWCWKPQSRGRCDRNHQCPITGCTGEKKDQDGVVCFHVHKGQEHMYPCSEGRLCSQRSTCPKMHDCLFATKGQTCFKRARNKCVMVHRDEDGFGCGQSGASASAAGEEEEKTSEPEGLSTLNTEEKEELAELTRAFHLQVPSVDCEKGRYCQQRMTRECRQNHICPQRNHCKQQTCVLVHPGQQKLRICAEGRRCSDPLCQRIRLHDCLAAVSGKVCEDPLGCAFRHASDPGFRHGQPQLELGSVSCSLVTHTCTFGRWCAGHNADNSCPYVHECPFADRCQIEDCHLVHPSQEASVPCRSGRHCQNPLCSKEHVCLLSVRGYPCRRQGVDRTPCNLVHCERGVFKPAICDTMLKKGDCREGESCRLLHKLTDRQWGDVLRGCHTNRMAMLKVFCSIPGPTLQHYRLLFDTFARKDGERSKLLEGIAALLAQGSLSKDEVYLSLLQAFRDDFARASLVWTHSQEEAGVTPSRALVVAYLLAHPNGAAARASFNRIRSQALKARRGSEGKDSEGGGSAGPVDTAVCNAVLRVHVESGDPQGALATFMELSKSNGITPDVGSLDLMCQAASSLAVARSLVQAALGKKNVRPQESTFLALLRRCVSTAEVRTVMKDMQLVGMQPGAFAYNELLRVANAAGKDEEGKIFAEMRRLRIRPNSCTYMLVACGAGASGNVEELFAMLQDANYVSTRALYTGLLSSLSPFPKIAQATFERMKEESIEPGAEHWNALIRASSSFKESLALFKSMMNASIGVSQETLAALMSAASAMSDVRVCLEVAVQCKSGSAVGGNFVYTLFDRLSFGVVQGAAEVMLDKSLWELVSRSLEGARIPIHMAARFLRLIYSNAGAIQLSKLLVLTQRVVSMCQFDVAWLQVILPSIDALRAAVKAHDKEVVGNFCSLIRSMQQAVVASGVRKVRVNTAIAQFLEALIDWSGSLPTRIRKEPVDALMSLRRLLSTGFALKGDETVDTLALTKAAMPSSKCMGDDMWKDFTLACPKECQHGRRIGHGKGRDLYLWESKKVKMGASKRRQMFVRMRWKPHVSADNLRQEVENLGVVQHMACHDHEQLFLPICGFFKPNSVIRFGVNIEFRHFIKTMCQHARKNEKSTRKSQIMQLLSVFERVARVLIVLHRNNMVHGHVCPGSIVVNSTAWEGFLVDFSLARRLGPMVDCLNGSQHQDVPEVSHVTEDDPTRLCPVMYRAPEQFIWNHVRPFFRSKLTGCVSPEGRVQTVTRFRDCIWCEKNEHLARNGADHTCSHPFSFPADIYSLGCTLLEALGRLLCEDFHMWGTSGGEPSEMLIARRMFSSHTIPTGLDRVRKALTKSLGKSRGDALTRVVRGCLLFDPRRRPHADELASMLRKCMGGSRSARDENKGGGWEHKTASKSGLEAGGDAALTGNDGVLGVEGAGGALVPTGGTSLAPPGLDYGGGRPLFEGSLTSALTKTYRPSVTPDWHRSLSSLLAFAAEGGAKPEELAGQLNGVMNELHQHITAKTTAAFRHGMEMNMHQWESSDRAPPSPPPGLGSMVGQNQFPPAMGGGVGTAGGDSLMPGFNTMGRVSPVDDHDSGDFHARLLPDDFGGSGSASIWGAVGTSSDSTAAELIGGLGFFDTPQEPEQTGPPGLEAQKTPTVAFRQLRFAPERTSPAMDALVVLRNALAAQVPDFSQKGFSPVVFAGLRVVLQALCLEISFIEIGPDFLSKRQRFIYPLVEFKQGEQHRSQLGMLWKSFEDDIINDATDTNAEVQKRSLRSLIARSVGLSWDSSATSPDQARTRLQQLMYAKRSSGFARHLHSLLVQDWVNQWGDRRFVWGPNVAVLRRGVHADAVALTPALLGGYADVLLAVAAAVETVGVGGEGPRAAFVADLRQAGLEIQDKGSPTLPTASLLRFFENVYVSGNGDENGKTRAAEAKSLSELQSAMKGAVGMSVGVVRKLWWLTRIAQSPSNVSEEEFDMWVQFMNAIEVLEQPRAVYYATCVREYCDLLREVLSATLWSSPDSQGSNDGSNEWDGADDGEGKMDGSGGGSGGLDLPGMGGLFGNGASGFSIWGSGGGDKGPGLFELNDFCHIIRSIDDALFSVSASIEDAQSAEVTQGWEMQNAEAKQEWESVEAP